MARSITDPDRQAQALAQVAEALAGAGQYEQAEAVARGPPSPTRTGRRRPWRRSRRRWPGPGSIEQAEAVARSITDPD